MPIQLFTPNYYPLQIVSSPLSHQSSVGERQVVQNTGRNPNRQRIRGPGKQTLHSSPREAESSQSSEEKEWVLLHYTLNTMRLHIDIIAAK